MAHRLEDLGYQVTAVEHNRFSVELLTEIRDLCEKKFKVMKCSMLEMQDQDLEYDVVFALNVFHHYFKAEQWFNRLDHFLTKLRCKMMIYQCHNPAERQMTGAYRLMDASESAEYLSRTLSLPKITTIGSYRTRNIFKLSGPIEAD